jgi:hypothetical protein
MKGMLRHRPSPAMVVALAALVVAVGGVAFATIPDSSGTIHGCFQKANGNLRVVESATDCRSSEIAISWNSQGPPGSPGANVVARLRGGPVTIPAHDQPEQTDHEINLGDASWTQATTEFQEVYIGVELAQGGCGVGVVVYVDGEVRGFEQRFFGSVEDDLDISLFEPDAPTTHRLRVVVNDRHSGCPEATTVKAIKVDVLGFR